MNLYQCPKGTKATIKDLPQTDDLTYRRFVSLGMNIGSSICLKQKSAFGGPCIVECNGKCIGLRKLDALRIEVEKR
ncbi:FeoA family protein [Metabacillus sp. RGM 3146]|uniref:FeoA family protein n=1 Tax=Metabacillus sp. RGM 3146 TaxID=3401092 RepID=UPI003B9C4930